MRQALPNKIKLGILYIYIYFIIIITIYAIFELPLLFGFKNLLFLTTRCYF